MNGRIKTSIVFVIILGVVLSSYGSCAAEQAQGIGKKPSAESMVVDFLVIRPLGIVATAVGTVIFVGSLPFSIAGGNAKVAYQKLVEEPTKFTFKRPLGEWEKGVWDY